MDNCLALNYTNIFLTIAASVIYKASHQHAMRFKQILFACRIPPLKLVICANCITRFLNFPRRGNDVLAVQKGGNLIFTQRIAFNGQ